ncbi:MAG TPA: type II/IV secretion system ATPase subunit [Candidatus Nanoarchaeia archaeon]|nr:type II/IV secretion system ATPase subunit [Candidatus Nanoarchaeia archaeon]
MVEQKKRADFAILKEGSEEVLKIDANLWDFSPSIEDNANSMSKVIDFILQNPSVSRVILNQKRNYIYSDEQTELLREIAFLYNHLIKGKKIFSVRGFTQEAINFFGTKNPELQYLILNLLRSDPLGCYVETKRVLREEKIVLQRETNPNLITARQEYLQVLQSILSLLEKTKMISLFINQLDGYSIGDRSFYRAVFRPSIMPDFMFTQIMAQPPLDAEQLDIYSVKDADTSIFRRKNEVKNFYHLMPPEFKLTEDKFELLDLARNVLAEHKPKEQEFLEPDKMRATFYNIGKDLIQELAESKGIELSYQEVEELAKILVRYTVGFGLLEVLLQDQKIQDITINSPIGRDPIFVVHQDYDECVTNVVPSREDAESWATKFRLLSGRPLDEANPVLDTELVIPNARARVAIMTRPLSPTGLAYAFRRHRDTPWTLPLFIKNKMISPLGAGLMSFLIDGARTILVAGTRSSGKTSFLGSLMSEIMNKYRIIVTEDTLELPIDAFRKLGYNIQNMKVRAALTSGTTEVGADEGIRTSLRLGDSALIVGEVRSVEAKALYEAMRIGALANVVAGTIHGADPYGVFDRVVNDLGVPRTSFKATDIVLVANPVKSADGLHKWKRVLQITEVRKHWQEDPLKEQGFMDLMKYDTKDDLLKPTDDLINGDSEVLKSIAGSIKEYAGNWDALWENVLLRAKMKETLVQYSEKAKMLEVLEADFVTMANDVFHRVSDQVQEEVGSQDSKRIFFEWDDIIKKEIKKRKL